MLPYQQVKKKNHMIMLIDSEKEFDRIQQHFMIHILSKLRIKGNFLSFMMRTYRNPTANIVLNGRLEYFSSKIGNRTLISAVLSLTQQNTGCSSYCNMEDKEIKDIQFGNRARELWPLMDAMVVYIENSMESTTLYSPPHPPQKNPTGINWVQQGRS